MPAKIKMVIRNGKLLPASREMIQQQLEEFADAHRRVKVLDVSIDVGNPAKAFAEIETPLGEQKFASKASANSAGEAVEDAILRLHRQLSQRLQERKSRGQQQEPVDRDANIMKIGKGVAAVLLASIFAVTMTRMDSCTYNPANYPETASVGGTITLDGQPLEGASIVFAPTTGRASGGRTDASGHYELRYVGKIMGAVLGTHGVEIRKEIPDPDFVVPSSLTTDGSDESAPLVNMLAERYSGRDSELSAEVKADDNSFDFDLTN